MTTIKILPYGAQPPYQYEAIVYHDETRDVFGETIAEGLPSLEEAKDRAALLLAERGLNAIAWVNRAGVTYEGRC